ncbi:MAG: tRNA (guanosine(37)-N1)-methyltransferase TrmD [Lachnospiraceae bacterium]|nr:tRNA (guanosine(37)-N1)-methyltransferase TrmD [Lachnospiraceae bacterium]
MKITVLTLFPELIETACTTSILGRAQEKGVLQVDTVNIRDYAQNTQGRVDDYPYGGGAGMVMQVTPIMLAYKKALEKMQTKPRVIYMSPQGKTLTQAMAEELAAEPELIFLCGHYEGIDERLIDLIVTDEVSIGDYVLTGGELPALVTIDAVARFVPGVLHNAESASFESFQDDLLEYPQYTRPETVEGLTVPEVLLSGHHAKIDEWRHKESLKRTLIKRPDLLARAVLSEKDKAYIRQLEQELKDQ